MKKDFSPQLVHMVRTYLGPKGRRFFKHLKGLTGTVVPTLRLNYKRRHMPAHPVHFREGMQIRNFLRTYAECTNWTAHDFDDTYVSVLEEAIK